MFVDFLESKMEVVSPFLSTCQAFECGLLPAAGSWVWTAVADIHSDNLWVCCCFSFTSSDRCIIRRRSWAEFSAGLFIQLKVQLFFMTTVDREVCGLSSKNLDIVSEKTRLCWMTVSYDWAPQRKFLSPPLANKAQTCTVHKANSSTDMTVRFSVSFEQKIEMYNTTEDCVRLKSRSD